MGTLENVMTACRCGGISYAGQSGPSPVRTVLRYGPRPAPNAPCVYLSPKCATYGLVLDVDPHVMPTPVPPYNPLALSIRCAAHPQPLARSPCPSPSSCQFADVQSCRLCLIYRHIYTHRHAAMRNFPDALMHISTRHFVFVIREYKLQQTHYQHP